MKRFFLAFLALTTAATVASADVTLSCGLSITPDQALGADRQYPFDTQALTPSPEGYEPFHIEHYGRHGSRYAYSPKYYDFPHKAFKNASKAGVLTELGKRIAKDFNAHYELYSLRMGDLSEAGWQDQTEIAGVMCGSFPEVFLTKGGSSQLKESTKCTAPYAVFATASNSIRSIMSMSAFCLGLKSHYPTLSIRQEQGRVFLFETNPRDKSNPDRLEEPVVAPCFTETLAQFQDSRIDSRAFLGKLFTDVDAACRNIDPRELVRRLYVLVAGMASLEEDIRTDFSGLFSEEEFAAMWEVDNYMRFTEYWPYFYLCTPAATAILDSGNKAAEGADSTRVHLRFGHDHVILPLCSILGIDGMQEKAKDVNEVAKYFHNFSSPMCANFQIIFYRSLRGNGEILIKLLLNGHEATLPVKSVSGPYCRWSDYEKWCRAHIAEIKQFYAR